MERHPTARHPWDGLTAPELVRAIAAGAGEFAGVRGYLKVCLAVAEPARRLPAATAADKCGPR